MAVGVSIAASYTYCASAEEGGDIRWTLAERKAIVSHGPWPPEAPHDETNAVNGLQTATVLGKHLFREKRLSITGKTSCATCHVPDAMFTDRRRVSVGLSEGFRNTPTVVNSAYQAWQGWGGGADSLWMQSIKPLIDDSEMGAGAEAVSRLMAQDHTYRKLYISTFGSSDSVDDPRSVLLAHEPDRVLVNVGKALASYIATLVSPRSLFDDYRDELAKGRDGSAVGFPMSAQRGLKLFVGRGRCSICHSGPVFSDGEFHDIFLPADPAKLDTGRLQGIEGLLASPFNSTGTFSDNSQGPRSRRTFFLAARPSAAGEFRTPSLRGTRETAPYMHDGRFGTIVEVLKHYSRLDSGAFHPHGETILKPLLLTDEEAHDLESFLRTLSPKTQVRGEVSEMVHGGRPPLE